MNTLEFLRAILPEDGVHYTAIFKPGFHAPAHKAFTSLEEMANAIVKMDAGDWTVYHACASYKEEFVEVDVKGTLKKKYRVEQNWNKAKCFWADLDCGEEKAAEGKGYLTKREAAIAMKAFCDKTGFPKPFYVDSGNGIHAYWPLTKAIPADTWVKMATMLKAVFAHHEVLADPSRTSDFASILRPVGSHNKKTDDFKPVEAKNKVEPIDPKELAIILKTLAQELPKQVAAPTKKYEINDDLTAHLPQAVHMDSSARTIAEKCNQMAIVRDTRGDVDYEQWRGALGIIKFCVEGNELAHEWSEGHPEYDYNATEEKIDSWEAGPTTCEFFSRCNPKGCAGCQHSGSIKTPMVLGRIVPEAKEEIVEATIEGKEVQIEVPAFPENYKFEDGRMVRYMQDKDEIWHPYNFALALFYPIYRVRKENGESAVGVRMHMPPPFNTTKEFEIDASLVASPQKLAEALGKYEVYSTGFKGANDHMSAYLRESIEKLKREAEELNTLTSFGWKDNMQSFLIGDRLYHHDGTVRKVLVGGNARVKMEAFPPPRGTVQGYSEALNFMYSGKDMIPMQYAIASGFGSVLTPLGPTIYKGLLMAITGGATAKGKTSVCLAAMYAFGNADKMKVGTEKGSTANARSAFMSTYQNIPLLLDEFTKISADEFSTLAYAISQGEDKIRMSVSTNKGVTFAGQESWALSPYITANTDLHGLLSTEVGNSQAEAVRVIQIRIDQYRLAKITNAEADAAMKQMELNMGSAGDAFMRFVVQHREEVLHRMATIGKRLEEAMPDVKYRFYRYHAICSLTAINITNQLGITRFDEESLYQFTLGLFEELANTITEQNTLTPEDALNGMITDLSPRFITSKDYRHGKDALGPEEVKYRGSANTVAGRYVEPQVGTNKKDVPYAGKLLICYKEVYAWCKKHRVEAKDILDWGKEHKLVEVPEKKISLGKGTTIKTGNANCWLVHMDRLEAQSPSSILSVVGRNSDEELTGT
jgi:hypothetical protein